MRVVHISDIHIWHYTWKPWRLFGKRAVGMVELATGRAKRFRLERIDAVIERVRALDADHILITGDVTTTALRSEYETAVAHLRPLLAQADRVTVVPGNHDRYTLRATRDRRFEAFFGNYMPAAQFPWLRPIGEGFVILGLDATRPHLTASGWIPPAQIAQAAELVKRLGADHVKLIVACHYPVAAPAAYQHDLARKPLTNAGAVRDWLATIGPHIYCCGHVHAAWAFTPVELPEQLCINAGAPLLHDPTGLHPPGFVELVLEERTVSVAHHFWNGTDWALAPLAQRSLWQTAPVG